MSMFWDFSDIYQWIIIIIIFFFLLEESDFEPNYICRLIVAGTSQINLQGIKCTNQCTIYFFLNRV